MSVPACAVSFFGLSAVGISTCDGAFVDMFFVGLVADLLNPYVLPVVFYAIFDAFNSCVMIQKSNAIFSKI